MTLTEFLTARLDEDEWTAHNATGSRWEWFEPGSAPYRNYGSRMMADGDIYNDNGPDPLESDGADHYVIVEGTTGEHVARWDPARVLAEVAAKRRIVEECGWITVMQHLASVYADHPDYREEWRVR